MTLPSRKNYRLKNFDYNTNGTYFVTVCVKDRKRILSEIVGAGVPDCPKIELLTHGIVADRYIKQFNDFYDYISVDKYIIMPDHIHLLLTVNQKEQSKTCVSASDSKNSVIAKFVSTFKRFCNKEFGENIWQARYYDHIIRNQTDYNETYEYIENNPLNWILKQKETESN